MTRPYFRNDIERYLWAEDVIAAAMEFDDHLARSIGKGKLKPIGRGASSIVFQAPRKGRVVRLTFESTAIPECEVMYDLQGENVVGWPRVYDVVNLNATEDCGPLCIGVIEKVTSAATMDRRTKRFKDVVEAAFLVSRWFPKPPEPPANGNDQMMRWALQLYEGLMEIDRDDHRYEIDLYDNGNWGIDSNDNAVWIDFGV